MEQEIKSNEKLRMIINSGIETVWAIGTSVAAAGALLKR